MSCPQSVTHVLSSCREESIKPIDRQTKHCYSVCTNKSQDASLTPNQPGTSLATMKAQIEPMQQPVRKVVGRPLTVSKQLVLLEDLTDFIKKHAHGALAKTEGDYFPVRKVVGRPRC